MKKFSEFYHDINGELRENFPLANLTWFKVGGPAQMLFIPENKDGYKIQNYIDAGSDTLC